MPNLNTTIVKVKQKHALNLIYLQQYLNTTIVKVKLKYHTSGTGPKWEFKYNYC